MHFIQKMFILCYTTYLQDSTSGGSEVQSPAGGSDVQSPAAGSEESPVFENSNNPLSLQVEDKTFLS